MAADDPQVVNGYCSLDELREHLGDGREQLQRGLLVRAINAASRAVDAYCGRRFWQDETPQTLLFNPTASCDLWLTQDISTTTGLSIATDDNNDGLYATPWDPTEYRLWPYSANTPGSEYGAWWRVDSPGHRRFDLRTARGLLPVQVTARFGWAFVPEPVAMATLLKATQLFKRKDAPFGIMQFGDIAAVRVTRQDGDVAEMLWPYQRDVAMIA